MEGEVGGTDVSDAKRLKALEDENSKLKRVLADAMCNRPVMAALWNAAVR
jgi:putative transposase